MVQIFLYNQEDLRILRQQKWSYFGHYNDVLDWIKWIKMTCNLWYTTHGYKISLRNCVLCICADRKWCCVPHMGKRMWTDWGYHGKVHSRWKRQITINILKNSVLCHTTYFMDYLFSYHVSVCYFWFIYCIIMYCTVMNLSRTS